MMRGQDVNPEAKKNILKYSIQLINFGNVHRIKDPKTKHLIESSPLNMI